MDVERCLSCGGPVIDGRPCPHCTSPIPSYSGPLAPTSAPPDTPALSSASGSGGILVVVLLAVLALYWIVTAVLLIVFATANRPGGDPFLIAIIGFFSLTVAGYTLYVIREVIQRRYRAQGQLLLASVVGACWGILVFLLLESPYRLLSVPLSVALGVLAFTKSSHPESRR